MRIRENQLGSPFWLPFIGNQGTSFMMEGNSFLQKRKKIYSTQKSQLDNFKRVLTQTNILFKLMNNFF